MLIEIEQDIIDKAIDDKNSSVNDAALFLTEMALAVKRGKHIVYVPSLNNNIDLSDKLEQVIGKNSVCLLKSSQRDRSKFHAIMYKLKTKAVCSYREDVEKNGFEKVIHINPSSMPGFETGTETHVIGENLSDIHVFDIMFYYYTSQNRLSGVHIQYSPLLGGGDTTNKVYEEECKSQKHFCLIITDSDFKLPCEPGKELDSIKEESTAGKVLKVHRDQKSKVSELYIMRSVSEIENLIPKKFLEKGENTLHNKVIDHDYSFYDIKKGLSYYQLRDSQIYEYWKKIYGSDVDFSVFDTLSSQHATFDTFKEAAKGKTLLPGWGNDILKQILEDPTNEKNMRQVKKDKLSNSQHSEWMKIGELIFNWTCALPPRYT